MLYGYALDDLGFFQMDLAEPDAPPSLLALISVLGSKTASPAIITDELRHLFWSDWDWEVTPISDHEFTAVFPDPVSLRYGTHSAELTLALNKLQVNISVPTVDPSAVAVLVPVWLQIRGLPPIARKERVIRSMSRLLGKIVEVDAASLLRGPVVRARVKCPDPSKLQTTLRFFFNDAGYDLRISVEGTSPVAPPAPSAGGVMLLAEMVMGAMTLTATVAGLAAAAALRALRRTRSPPSTAPPRADPLLRLAPGPLRRTRSWRLVRIYRPSRPSWRLSLPSLRTHPSRCFSPLRLNLPVMRGVAR